MHQEQPHFAYQLRKSGDAGLGLPAGAVRLAVQKGRGSARDAESALEQLAAIGGEEGDTSYIDNLFSELAERDAGAVFQAVAKASLRGVEPRRLGSELVERLREAFLAFQAPALVQLPPAEAGRVAELSRAMGLPLLVRSMEAVGKALVEMRDSVDPRVTLEVALVRLASPARGTSLEALVERIERLERALAALPAQGATLGKEPPTAPPAPSPGPGVRTGAGPQGEATLSGAVAGGQSRSVADGPPAPSAPESTNQAGGSSTRSTGALPRTSGRQGQPNTSVGTYVPWFWICYRLSIQTPYCAGSTGSLPTCRTQC